VRAVVLVGGEGTRLRPLTLTTPKPLLPIAGVRLIERVVRHLAEHGVDDVVLSIGYKPDAFRAAFPSNECAGVPISYAVEDEPLDTGGAIAFAAGEAGIDERFIVVNGDVISEVDLTALVGFHEHSGASATVSLVAVDDPSRFGVVVTNADGRVTAFVEKPAAGEAPSNLINAGTYVMEPRAIRDLPRGERVSVERTVFPSLAARGELYALASDAYWIDTGNPTSYIQANVDIAGGAAIDATADVHATAVVIDSVVFRGATVGKGARVERSIIGAGAVIGDNAVVADFSVVADGASIPADAICEGERVEA